MPLASDYRTPTFARAFLRPHFQLDAWTISLRLVVRLSWTGACSRCTAVVGKRNRSDNAMIAVRRAAALAGPCSYDLLCVRKL